MRSNNSYKVLLYDNLVRVEGNTEGNAQNAIVISGLIGKLRKGNGQVSGLDENNRENGAMTI